MKDFGLFICIPWLTPNSLCSPGCPGAHRYQLLSGAPWESPSSSYETDLYFPDLGFYGPEILSTGFWGWNKHIRTLHSHQCMPYHLSRNDSADKGTCCAGPRTWVQFSGPTVKGEAPLLGVFPWPPHVHHNTHTSWHVHVHTYTVHAYMHNNNNK